MFDAADFDDLYADLGQPATHQPPTGAHVTGRVILSQPGQGVIGDEVVTLEPVVRYQPGPFPGVVRGSVFVVGGKRWRVRGAPQPLVDGLEAEAPVEVTA